MGSSRGAGRGGRMSALTLLLGVAMTGAAQGQALKAALLGDPPVGRTAPEIRLLYWRDGAPGPVDQPFRLGAELGRVVVLAFGGAPGRAGWSDLAARTDSLGSPRIELVAVARARIGSMATLSGGPGLKVLADSLGLVHRQYGVRPNDGWAVFVVADDGRLIWKDRRANLGSPAWWARLVEAARRGVPEGRR